MRYVSPLIVWLSLPLQSLHNKRHCSSLPSSLTILSLSRNILAHLFWDMSVGRPTSPRVYYSTFLLPSAEKGEGKGRGGGRFYVSRDLSIHPVASSVLLPAGHRHCSAALCSIHSFAWQQYDKMEIALQTCAPRSIIELKRWIEKMMVNLIFERGAERHAMRSFNMPQVWFYFTSVALLQVTKCFTAVWFLWGWKQLGW